ncbi:MAG: purine-nucleoside phosphorylase [Spirochaetes bacterium]|nr:purine-nucleoside phosphorylase [Spirochaetota bacterium]
MRSGFTERVEAAFASLPAGARGRRPSVGIVLGSGLGAFAASVRGASAAFASIEGFPKPTVEGHGGMMTVGGDVAVLAGRVHYYEGHEPDDVVLPVFLLHRLGVRTLVVTNAAGGVNRSYAPGLLVLIRDHLNLAGFNPLRGPDHGPGPRFPDMSTAYSPRLRELARQAAGEPIPEGVYAALAGPCYETPAEIRMLAGLGADLVGMSTVPEVIAARSLGIEVLGVSCVTNMAAGILDQPLDHAEVMARGREAAPRFERLLAETVRLLGGSLDAG